jgi:hypothetical protein
MPKSDHDRSSKDRGQTDLPTSPSARELKQKANVFWRVRSLRLNFLVSLASSKRLSKKRQLPMDFRADYEALKKKLKKVGGKLNGPLERFHFAGRSTYEWAGLQFLISDPKR